MFGYHRAITARNFTYALQVSITVPVSRSRPSSFSAPSARGRKGVTPADVRQVIELVFKAYREVNMRGTRTPA